METQRKTAIIIGAGPAGLTAALELLETTDIHPIILEASGEIGGISRTVDTGGNRMDIGGHRFFSKDPRIMEWWKNILPLQGALSLDDILLDREKPLEPGGPDPEVEDRVMLVRERVSRILFRRHFFDYPVSLNWSTLSGMGFRNTLRAGFGYLAACLHPLPEDSLENFYINRFGRPLYEMFFEAYTEKVWGVHPSRIGADWGAQRVKGLSILSVLKDVLSRPFRRKNLDQKHVETSLIEQFIYPKYGPGQLWETVADRIRDKGGEILLHHPVRAVAFRPDGGMASVQAETPDGPQEFTGDWFFSSMSVRDLCEAVPPAQIPAGVRAVATALPYRDFITVGVLAKQLKIRNTTHIRTYAGRVPDTWIYIQERDVKVGRLQLFNNWSPYMVADYRGTVFVGMEYFCNEGDALWELSREDFVKMALQELEKIGVMDPADVLQAHCVKVKKAYPAYFGSYSDFPKVREWLDGIDNLFCIGRNGQHRYNNMDHSMLTAMEAVRCIREGITDKSTVWNVNTEKTYHESK